jgi:hypothetical protein
MATIIVEENSSGVRRRCDGTCHNALKSKCVCVCGGKFHGCAVRRDMAEARREMEDIILTKAAERIIEHPFDTVGMWNQPSLFEDEETDAKEAVAEITA